MTEVRWKKARASAEQTDCVELAHTLDAVRDSKSSDGQALQLPVAGLLAAIKAGASIAEMF